jgi:hypothetical protein
MLTSVMSEAATLIGDLVGSRTSADRRALHARVETLLAEVNETMDPVTPLRITVGDEYQGAFADVGSAARAALRLRVGLLPEHDVRHGLGWGGYAVLQEEPRVEDGAGWWVARDAVHVVELAEDRPATRWRRTAYVSADPVDPAAAWIESTLVLRDQLVDALSPRGLSVLRGLLQGRTQKEIAHELGISASAVSQRVRADGLGAVMMTEELLERGDGGVR